MSDQQKELIEPENQAHALLITAKQIPEIAFEEPIEKTIPQCCEYFLSDYNKAAKAAKEGGDISRYEVFHSIKTLCSFRLHTDEASNPFLPMGISGSKRTTIPDDLTPEDLNSVKHLLIKAKLPPIRARLGDILWVRLRNHHDAQQTVKDYLISAEEIFQTDEWFHGIDLLHRAFQIASQLGRKGLSWKEAEKFFQKILVEPRVASTKQFLFHLLRISSEMRFGHFDELSKLAHTQAELMESEKNYFSGREYHLLRADFERFRKDEGSELEAKRRAAKCLILEAEKRIQTDRSYLAASGHLVQAIEELRQAKEPPENIEKLYVLLRDYQDKSMGEMGTLSVPVDWSKPASAAVKHVSDLPFNEALVRFAFMVPMINLKELKEEVIKTSQMNPLMHAVGSVICDDKGRTVAKMKGLLSAEEDEAEEAMLQQMFFHGRYRWEFRANALLQPALNAIWSQHFPRPGDFRWLAIGNPFIPLGHESIFARGLFYYFSGDQLLAAHLLIPQVENSMRSLLEARGVKIANLKSDLTQPMRMLGQLLTMPESITFFGESFCFELRGLLIEKFGYGFRDEVAHGRVTENECYCAATMNICWIILRTLLLPFLSQESSKVQNSVDPNMGK